MYPIDKVRTFAIDELSAYSVLTDKATRDKFVALYYFAFGDMIACEGCESEVERAITRFKAFLKMHTTETELQKSTTLMRYEMKPNTRVFSTTLGMMVTRANCTDAIAKTIIAEKESNINLFDINEGYVEEKPKAVTRKARTRKPKAIA
jgi:hypothetical protein